jgi:hypothetical protein
MSTRRLKVTAMDAALVAGVKIDSVERFCRELRVSPRTFYRHRARIDRVSWNPLTGPHLPHR